MSVLCLPVLLAELTRQQALCDGRESGLVLALVMLMIDGSGLQAWHAHGIRNASAGHLSSLCQGPAAEQQLHC